LYQLLKSVQLGKKMMLIDNMVEFRKILL